MPGLTGVGLAVPAAVGRVQIRGFSALVQRGAVVVDYDLVDAEDCQCAGELPGQLCFKVVCLGAGEGDGVLVWSWSGFGRAWRLTHFAITLPGRATLTV